MYEVSAAFGSLIASDTRTFTATISADGADPITEGIQNIHFNGGSNGEDDFSLGSVFSQYVEITLTDPPILLEGREFTLYFGAEVNGSIELIPMGVFIAGKPESSENSTKFTAYDRIQLLERAFFPELPDSTNTIAVLNEIFRITGVPIVTTGLQSIAMTRPEGYTCRETLAYIAQLYGGFAVCNRQGQIEIRWYEDAGYSIPPERYWEPITHNDYAMVVQKLTFYIDDNDTSVSVGSGAREVAFSNPFMTQDILDDIWETLENYTYMPGKVSFLGDPRLDPWDVITAEDLEGNTFVMPCMTLCHEYDGGLKTTVEAVAKTESDQQTKYEGPSATKMKRMVTELALINNALINKLDVDTAEIRYATITSLNAVDAHVGTLDTQVANISSLIATDLTAATANISSLQAQYANIATLLTGNQASGDITTITLTAANTTIDSALIRQAVMQNVTIYDLIAGKISTDQIAVGSNDNGMLLSGDLLQMRDASGNLRIQMGQDANGNFTFILYDATGSGVLMDATGIKPSAISDGLIVNSMVAADAAISGSKLDIASVISAINGSSSTINSTRIYLDEAGQTLTQVYSTMNQSISVAESTANSASATAENALRVLSGISTLDALGVVLSNEAAVVHTDTDGTNGDYTDCFTKVTVLLGDTNVTSRAVMTVETSAGITGAWNASTRTYYVTNMTTDNGWVDITVLYGTEWGYMLDRNGNYITDRNGNHLTSRSGGSYITKRFSISKSPDGKAGVNYKLQTSAEYITKALDGSYTPATVTVSSLYTSDDVTTAYLGRYKIEESIDAVTFTEKYFSAAAEAFHTHTPTSGIKVLRITLYDPTGLQILDSRNIVIMTDAEELSDEIEAVQQAMVATNSHISQIETSVEGLRVGISDVSTQLQGLSDGTLLFQTPYTTSGDLVTFTARVYKAGENVTDDFIPAQFRWYRRTETGDEYLGYGYTKTIDKADMGLGGVIIGVFTTRAAGLLMDRNSNYITDRNGNRIETYIEEVE